MNKLLKFTVLLFMIVTLTSCSNDDDNLALNTPDSPYKFSLEVIDPPTNLNREVTVQSQKPDLFWVSEIKAVTYANPYVEFDIPLGAISTEVFTQSFSGRVVHYKIYNSNEIVREYNGVTSTVYGISFEYFY